MNLYRALISDVLKVVFNLCCYRKILRILISLSKAMVSHFTILHSLSQLNDYKNLLFHVKLKISNINSMYLTKW